MFLRSGGWSVVTEPGKQDIEHDTFSCGHCNQVVFVSARTSPEDMGGRCTCCDKLICKKCVGKGCTPLEEQIRMMEDPLYKRRRSYRMGL